MTAAGRGRREESQIPKVWWGWSGCSSTVLLGRSQWERVAWGKVLARGYRENNEGVSGDALQEIVLSEGKDPTHSLG